MTFGLSAMGHPSIVRSDVFYLRMCYVEGFMHAVETLQASVSIVAVV